MENKYRLDRLHTKMCGWAYELIDVEKDEILLCGDGYETEEAMIIELSTLSEAFRAIFG